MFRFTQGRESLQNGRFGLGKDQHKNTLKLIKFSLSHVGKNIYQGLFYQALALIISAKSIHFQNLKALKIDILWIFLMKI
ncbi:hypothetical protein DMC01_03900 [Campylobacter troglodytis]|nr:hypothetical protein DMC01_03900 [Campylobacter troglodytis]